MILQKKQKGKVMKISTWKINIWDYKHNIKHPNQRNNQKRIVVKYEPKLYPWYYKTERQITENIDLEIYYSDQHNNQ